MKRLVVFLVIALMIIMGVGGCAYLAPDTSKALSEQDQFKEQKKQTQLEERQAEALERIADALEEYNRNNR